jgi:hypothetical protein
MERRILCGELWPHMGAEAGKYNYFDNAGAKWHFRGEVPCDERPQPSTRATTVLDLVGVDWCQPKDDMGLYHEDSGERPALPAGRPSADDSILLKFEEQIFEQHEAVIAYSDEILRLFDIWCGESKRLYEEALIGRCMLSDKEWWDLVGEMPECKEHTRLAGLQDLHYAEMDKLVKQMWAIPARTPEGRRAKVLVLLECIMPDDWCVSRSDEDYGIRETRDLLIEFVGGEPAAQLRDRFSA